MRWFEGHSAVGTIALGLRWIEVCTAQDVCASVSLKHVTGLYPMAASVALWSGIVFVAAVAGQCGLRLIGGAAYERLASKCYLLGMSAAAAALATSYMFGPDPDELASGLLAITFERTWAPLVMVGGHLAGILAIYYSMVHETSDEAAPYTALPGARVMPAPGARAGSAAAEAHGDTAADATASRRARAGATVPMPPQLRGQIAYTAVAADVTRAGLDARLESGSPRLVLWRDVVGAVARRLPPEHGSAPFVDVVSAAGATLRVLPWTKLTGDALPGAPAGAGELVPLTDPDLDRVRAILALVVERCPTAHLDRATSAVHLDRAPPPQLPDLATLAAHDARLA